MLLVDMVISTIVTRRVYKWHLSRHYMVESVELHCSRIKQEKVRCLDQMCLGMLRSK
jgi:hypothetical protein